MRLKYNVVIASNTTLTQSIIQSNIVVGNNGKSFKVLRTGVIWAPIDIE